MLAKKYRLTKNGSFNYVYKKGKSNKSAYLSLNFVSGGKGVKIGFSVPNKIGKAVVRNKVKRRLRAAAQFFIKRISSVQAVFSAKNGIENCSFCEILNMMDKQLKLSGLLV